MKRPVSAPSKLSVPIVDRSADREMRLLEGQKPSSVPNHVRVGDAIVEGFGSLGQRLAEARELRPARLVLGQETRCPDPSVAVGRPALPERDRMHHAVAGKPVIRLDGGQARVRTVSVESAVERAGQPSLDREVVRDQLVVNGRVIAGQER